MSKKITKDLPREKEANVVARFKRILAKLFHPDQYSYDKPPSNQFGDNGRADIRIKWGWFINIDIEMKRSKGSLSPNQRELMARNNRRHPLSPYIVCYGNDGVDELIEALGKLGNSMSLWELMKFADRVVYPAKKRIKQNVLQGLLKTDMPYTHSMLNEFMTCSKKYHGNYHTRNHRNVWTSTPEKDKGKEVHQGFEMAFTHNMPLPPGCITDKNKWVYNRIKSLQARLAPATVEGNGGLTMEMGLAIDSNGLAVPYNSRNALFRGVLDITIISHGQAKIYLGDLKNGKSAYSTPKQLERSAVLLFAHYPACTHIMAEYHWLMEDKQPEVITFERIPSQMGVDKGWKAESLLKDELVYDIALIKSAEGSGNWPNSPGGLCKSYCANKSCDAHPDYDPKLAA